MNYYPRNIGDYIGATAHLSMLEDGAYNRLLDWYYLDESPIPNDPRAIYRRCRAQSEDERAAVDVILSEFFVLDPDANAFRHSRADAEISKYKDKADKAVQAAKQRWNADASKKHADASKTNADASKTHSPKQCERNANQEPRTKNQEPIGENPLCPPRPVSAGPPISAPLPEWLDPDDWNRWEAYRRAKSGKAWTAEAKRLAVLKLDRLRVDEEPASLIDRAIESGWSSFFARTRRSDHPPNGDGGDDVWSEIMGTDRTIDGDVREVQTTEEISR
mgnify:FL=1